MQRGVISINGTNIHIELAEGTVWLTKSEIARLFGVFVQTVSANLREVFKGKELFEHEVTRNLNGVAYYNLDVVTALAFRMKGGRCRLFREWVREQIKRPIVKRQQQPIVIQLGETTFLS